MFSAKKAASPLPIDDWHGHIQRFNRKSSEGRLISEIEDALKKLTGETCGFVLHVHNLKPEHLIRTFSNLESDDAFSLSQRVLLQEGRS